MAKKIRVTKDQIIKKVRGWCHVQFATGEVRKYRESQLIIGEGDGLRRIGDKRYNFKAYVEAKSAEGNSSMDCGDPVAKQLREKTLDEVYKIAAKETGIPATQLREKYKHLNQGMQRMNLGNKIRFARAEGEEAA